MHNLRTFDNDEIPDSVAYSRKNFNDDLADENAIEQDRLD